MNQLFLQLAQTVSGNVITIVALELGAAIIGFIIAWYYARSVYTPVIKGLEADKASLSDQITGLKDEYGKFDEKVKKLNEKVSRLEKEKAEKDIEIKDLSTKTISVGKYVISKARNGETLFNLKATNGQIILTSLMYPTLADCTKGIESVKENCGDDNRFERKISTNNKHYFNLTGPSGHVIGKSEMYEAPAGMETGIASVKRNGISNTVVEE
jgi:uncharacterized protein YegP (UPF0339 family)